MLIWSRWKKNWFDVKCKKKKKCSKFPYFFLFKIFKMYMKDPESAELKEKQNFRYFRFFFYRVMVIFVTSSPQFSMIFRDNSKNIYQKNLIFISIQPIPDLSCKFEHFWKKNGKKKLVKNVRTFLKKKKFKISFFLVGSFAPHQTASRVWDFFLGLVDPSRNRLASTTYFEIISSIILGGLLSDGFFVRGLMVGGFRPRTVSRTTGMSFYSVGAYAHLYANPLMK